MAEEKQTKSMRQISLKVDQFEINEDGEVVIKSDEVMETLQSQLTQGTSTEAGGTKVGITVKSSSK